MVILKREILTNSIRQITELCAKGELVLPDDYVVSNAMQNAWLVLMETVDRDKRPVLEVCTKVSIINALRRMAIQGLDVAKQQCYFIARKDVLCLDRSYWGDIAIAQRVVPGIEVRFDLVYADDEVEFRITNGLKEIVVSSKPANVDDNKIVGAYCIVVNEFGVVIRSDYMSLDQIKKSWTMSKTYKPENEGGTHVTFKGRMCNRTVVRRCVSPIWRTSTDKHLMAAIRESEIDVIESDLADAAELNANVMPILEAQSTVTTAIPTTAQPAAADAFDKMADAVLVPETPVEEQAPWNSSP